LERDKKFTKRRTMNKEEIIKVLKEIKQSVNKDIDLALKAYLKHWEKEKEGVGFWVFPRMLFPEIDGLASFYTGNTSSSANAENAVKFMREYFGRIDKDYSEISGFIYYAYRHSLMHCHYPREIQLVSGKKISWAFIINPTELKSRVLEFHTNKNILSIDCVQLFRDFLKALDFYIKDFDAPNKAKELIPNFEKAYNEMHRLRTEQEVRKNKFIKDSDLDYFQKVECPKCNSKDTRFVESQDEM